VLILISPTISVIVPAYNVEKYIQRCIDSIVSQTFKEYEIIVVNDCSTDCTAQIIETYYNDNAQIKMIHHEENKGLGPARNTGIDHAKGEYIFFVDSDDWIAPTMLQYLYALAQMHHADITACGICYAYEDGRHETFHANQIITVGGAVALELLARYVIPDVAWNKLYKRELIVSHQLRFAPIYHEDFNFAVEALYYCNLYVSMPDQLYYYYQSSHSIIRSKPTEKHIYSYIELFKLFNRFVKKINKFAPLISDEAIGKIYSSLIHTIIRRMNNVYQQLNADERVKLLSKVFEQQFGDGYFFIQGMMDHFMDKTDRPNSNDSDVTPHTYEERLAAGETFSPRDLYNYANELRDQGRHQAAIEFYEKFLVSKQGGIEENITACDKVADCFLALNNPEKHLEYIYRSFTYDTPRAEFCCLLGFHHLQANELKQATFWYKAATKLEKPTDCSGILNACWTWLPHLQLCVCYDKLGKHKLACEHNEIAATYAPDHSGILYNRTYFENLFNEIKS